MPRRPMRFLLAGFAALLPGCATVIDGSQQQIAVVTEPPGALCAVDRGGVVVGTVQRTPGIVQFERSKQDVAVSCVKDGYGAVIAAVPSRFTGMTFANFALGFGAGSAAAFLVDAATGSNWTYSSPVTLRLARGPALPARRIVAVDAYGSPTP